MKCRSCGNEQFSAFADLQTCPPSNAMLTTETLHAPEVYYPLVVKACTACFLVQIDEAKRATEIFDANYTYFSSFSRSWLHHCERAASAAIARLGLDARSLVVEVASNDGYLLQYFKAAGIEVLGVEPTANTAQVAIDKDIPTIVDFFSSGFAEKLVSNSRKADLIIGNNVFAHVPEINDFTRGLKIMLAEGGAVSLEFPHVLRLIAETQFDTVYHEHYSYLSLTTTVDIFARAGLKVFDVEEVSTHGGSLRVWGAHFDDTSKTVTDSVAALLRIEKDAGLQSPETYESFQPRIDRVRDDFLAFLIEQRRAGRTVAGYGAAAKGNTLLNYCGVKGPSLINFVCDLSPHKQGKFLPGSRIPVLSPDAIAAIKPDFVVIFPWNIKTEVIEQLGMIRDWGGKFVVAVPELSII
jgi:C-methyltransferase C-terminal domain/Putative zinc binding domain/Methyltransferase domain